MLQRQAHAQQQVILSLQDYFSNEPISGAQVDLLDSTLQKVITTSISNVHGEAIIEGLPPINVRISHAQYETETIKVATPQASTQLIKKTQALDGVVVTGMMAPVKRRDALSAISTISATTIRQLGATTLDQVLGYQPNITIGQDDILGTTIRMMGMGGDKVKVLIDGIPINGREGGNINLNQISLYNTDKIEIVNGPMSLVYGSDALGGVINVITTNPPNKKSIQLQTQYETVGRYNAYLQGQLPIKKRHLISGGMGRNFFSGYKLLDTGYYPRRLLFKPTEQYPAHLRYAYIAPSGFRAQLASDALKETIENKGTAMASSISAFAQDQYYKTTRAANRLLLSGKLGEHINWQTTTSYMYYRRIRQTFSKNLVTLEQNLVPVPSLQDTSIFTDINQRGTIEQKIGLLHYTAGFDITTSYARSHKIADGTASVQDYALWAAIRTGLLNETISLSAGARAAANSKYQVPILPTFQLLYKPIKQIQFRANYTKAYRAPSLKELYLEFIDPQHRILGNRALKPEEGNHYQATLAWQAYEKGANYIQLNLSGFHNRVRNEINLVPTNPLDSNSIDYTYGNITAYRNFITNIELQVQLNMVYLQLGYNWGYTYLPNRDYEFHERSYQAQLNYLWKKPAITVALYYKYLGPKPFLRSNIDGTASYEGKQPGYQLADASVSKRLFKRRLQLTVGCKNIFNTQTLVATGLSGASRGHSGSGTLNFLPRNGFVSLALTL